MTTYPIHFNVEPPTHFSRLQLAVRILTFFALGALGTSFGAAFLFAYLALPAFAASRLASGRDPEVYVREDGRRILGVLRWFSAVSAWAGLATDKLPINTPSETVVLRVDAWARPSATSALWRVVSGIPSALVLTLLCWLGTLVWLWAAVSILFTERVGPRAFDYLVGLQRWSFRLLVYQASLVDEYPPYSFEDTPPQVLMSQSPAT